MYSTYTNFPIIFLKVKKSLERRDHRLPASLAVSFNDEVSIYSIGIIFYFRNFKNIVIKISLFVIIPQNFLCYKLDFLISEIPLLSIQNSYHKW